MKGQIVMITGANAGIGKQTALELARLGATIVMVARNRERGEAARAEVAAASGNGQVDLLISDLSSQASIRAMVEAFRARYDRLNVLVNNAGVYLTRREETVDGLEMTFATNHLGYFLPTVLLWDLLAAGAPARVINVSSDAHRGAKLDFDDLQSRRRYSGFGVYGRSKLANLLFTYELDRRRGAADVTVNALHPGFVASNFGRGNRGVVGLFMTRLVPLFARTVEQGAATSVYLAASPKVAGISGRYFTDCQAVQSSPASYDRAAAAQLWAVSEALTGEATPHLAIPA
ncbi:SDR family oxidoreductase [Promineifilum sp.]|uniref:SDR family oxidoreductase n=1 Tax=Promineifilum sp. TaxID=2664178 RepID=UPI0035AEC3E3